MPEPIKVFISYARQDIKELNELTKRLKPIENDGEITVWHDQMIDQKKEWYNDINENINACDIIVFLISADLCASTFVCNTEIPLAIKRYEKKEVTIVPILIKTTPNINRIRLDKFNHIPVNPDTGELTPIEEWKNQNRAWKIVVEQHLENVFRDIRETREEKIQNTQTQEAAIQAAYQKAEKDDTLEAWKEFHDKYPNHEKKRIHELTEDNKVFQELKQSINPTSLIEEYLKNTKETQNKAEAKQIINHWKELMKLYDAHKDNWAEWMEQIQSFEAAEKNGTWAKFQNSVPIKKEVLRAEAVLAIVIAVLLIVLWFRIK